MTSRGDSLTSRRQMEPRGNPPHEKVRCAKMPAVHAKRYDGGLVPVPAAVVAG
jgi:hypothetical protein